MVIENLLFARFPARYWVYKKSVGYFAQAFEELRAWQSIKRTVQGYAEQGPQESLEWE